MEGAEKWESRNTDVVYSGIVAFRLRRRERLKNDRLKDEDDASVQARSRIVMAGSFFCRTNLSVNVSSE